MKTKNFCTKLVFLTILIVPGAFSMQSAASSGNEKSYPVSEPSTAAATELIAYPFVFFLEKGLPYAEISLSDGQKLNIDARGLEKYLTAGNCSTPAGTQILQANFRQPGPVCYEIDFERTLLWNTYLLRHTTAQLNITKTLPSSAEQKEQVRLLTIHLDQQYKNLRSCLTTPACPDKETVIKTFAQAYVKTENISQEQAQKKATLFYTFLQNKAPNPDTIEYFTQTAWSELFARDCAFALTVEDDGRDRFFNAEQLENFLTHASRKNPLANQHLYSVVFKKCNATFDYELDSEKTCHWNLVLLKESKATFDTIGANLENIEKDIARLENLKTVLLSQQKLPKSENRDLTERIEALCSKEEQLKTQQCATIFRINQQILSFAKCITNRACSATLRTSSALCLAEILLDINQFETISCANDWIIFAHKHFDSATLSPESTALYDFLDSQREFMDGHREIAYEVLKKINPKFLSQKHNAKRDLALADVELHSLPHDLAPKHYKTIVAIQTHLNRAHIAALSPDGHSTLFPLETATLEDYRIKTASLFNFLHAMNCLPGDEAAVAAFESLQKIDSRFLSKRNRAQKDLWSAGYYIHHLLPEIGPEQYKQLTEAHTHLSWAEAESFEPTGSIFSPEEQKLCAVYHNLLEKHLDAYK